MFANVSLNITICIFDTRPCPISDLHYSIQSSVIFDTYKNRTCGKLIAHTYSEYLFTWPVKTVVHHIIFLCQYNILYNSHLRSCWANTQCLQLMLITIDINSSHHLQLLYHHWITGHLTCPNTTYTHEVPYIYCVDTFLLMSLKTIKQWCLDVIFSYIHVQALYYLCAKFCTPYKFMETTLLLLVANFLNILWISLAKIPSTQLTRIRSSHNPPQPTTYRSLWLNKHIVETILNI